MGSRTGTYIETNAHYFKDEKKLSDVPIEKLFMVNATVLNLKLKGPPCDTLKQLDRSPEGLVGWEICTLVVVACNQLSPLGNGR
jgi:kynurenine formamidase